MNLKSLLASACVIGTSFFVPVEPANAGTCWYLNGGAEQGQYCRTVRRINHNGHVVFDITDGLGKTFTVILWDDSVAEVVGFTARPMQQRTYVDSQGDTRIIWNDGTEFAFNHH